MSAPITQNEAQRGLVKTDHFSEPDVVRLNNGKLMPLLGFGTFQQQSPDIITEALDVGFRHLDCAALYMNEDMVGQGIAKWLAANPQKNKREDLFITSKVFNDHHRPALLRQQAEKSIADLGCGYLDLYLMHWPDAFKPGSNSHFHGEVCSIDGPKVSSDGIHCVTFDDEVTLEETWRAMEKLVDDGLVKSIGVSNFSYYQIKDLVGLARIKPAINEIELHPFLQQRKLVQKCFEMGVQSLAYGPLGGPNAYVPNDLLPHPVVSQIAKECGKTNGQVLVKWSMQRGVPVLVKTSNSKRLHENFDGMHDWHMSEDQMERLYSLESGKRFVDVAWKKWDERPIED